MSKYEGLTMEQLMALLEEKDRMIDTLAKDDTLLKRQRKMVLGVNRDVLAQQIGISINTLANWETSRTSPDWYRLDTVFEAYQLSDEQKLEYIYEVIAKAKERQANKTEPTEATAE